MGTVKPAKTTGAVKFEVFMGPEGKYIFNLFGRDGKLITSSRGFQSKDGCMQGIRAVKDNAQGMDTLKRKTLESGAFAFTLCMPNRQVVLEGGPYETTELCDAAMAEVRLTPQAVIINRG